MRLLVIEDDQQIARNVKDFLEKEGFAVNVAYDGEDGEFQALEEAYDAIVLDINLPIFRKKTVSRSSRPYE